ncbi:MAG: hypothetical protein ABW194_06455 [Novosphingobium sp.]
MTEIVPGLRAPAFFCAALAGLAVATSASAQAPPRTLTPAPAAQPQLSAQPVPSELELAKMIWSTMAMVDHANRSGNYSVLRDTSATGFQIQNDPARLAEIFARIRQSRVDLSNALILAPTYSGPPRLLQADVFQVQGYFPLRPTPIFFDLYFQWEQGRWKLFGISLNPGAMIDPGAAPPPAPAVQPPRRRRN